MPWKECKPMDERLKFIARCRDQVLKPPSPCSRREYKLVIPTTARIARIPLP